VKEILAFPDHLDYDESMETTNGTEVENMENIEEFQFDENAYKQDLIDHMATLADCGDPRAEHLMANGYAETVMARIMDI
jgi:hypothetical protein